MGESAAAPPLDTHLTSETDNIEDMNWFETTSKYATTGENGLPKKSAHHILIDAINYTEAETRTIKELDCELEITNVQQRKYVEVIRSTTDTDDVWWHAALEYIVPDEKTMAEKRTKVLMLVEADTISTAVKRIHELMNRGMIDYEIVAVKKSPIEDVYSKEIKR